MMNHEQLGLLIEQLDKSSLAYLNYETDDVKVVLSKEMPQEASVQHVHAEQAKTVQPIAVEQVQEQPQLDVKQVESADAESDTATYITSPMVGVVYLQPSPDKDSFVKVGDTVNEGDTVVIIEAMKLMNEIHANTSGTVVEILVENETVVEFGQPLIRIK